MKKKSTILLFLILAFAGIGQTPGFFNQAGGIANTQPFNINTSPRKAQWFLPPGNLGVGPGNVITHVYFQFGSTVTKVYPLVNLRMKTGSGTSLPVGAYETGLTLVFSATNFQIAATANGWFQIALQTPFVYDPTQPLVVEFEHNSTAGTGPTVLQTATTAPGPWVHWGDFNSTAPTSNSSTRMINLGVDVIPNTPCSGAPPVNSVFPSSYSTCPGLANPEVGFANTYSLGGIEYQWYESVTSQLGPWTPVSGATLATAQIPTLGVTTWFQAVASCTNLPNSTTSLTPARFYVEQNVVVDNAPYYEDFEGILMNDRLPNCSWASNALASTALTYIGAESMNRLPRSGNKFAAFKNSPAGTSYYYTNGINLSSGITYSASVWYQTDLSGANNWSDFSLMLGSSQSAAGLTTIASTGGPAVSLIYKPLSGTFTVPNSGVYYIAVKATGASGTAEYLSWDDLSVEIPCALNTPSVSMSANKTSICAGESIVLTATGADIFSWDNSAGSGGMVTVQPLYNTYYTVVGTNTNSGCSSAVSQMIQVRPVPVVGVVGFPAVACAGAPLNLQAHGADFYAWSTGDNSSSVVVKPTGPTSYTIQGTNIHGCTTAHVLNVSPNMPPQIQAIVPPSICAGDRIVGSATGAASYKWISNLSYITGNNVLLSPNISTTYTVEGTDIAGCTGEHIVTITVDACTGINGVGKTSGLSLYPNPNSGTFVVNTGTTHSKRIQVTDITGRVIISTATTESEFDVNIKEFAAGVYYVEVSSFESLNRIKVIKQ